MSGPGLRAAAALLFVFAAGVFAGIFLDRHHLMAPATDATPAQEHARALADLRESLELDEHQMDRIHAILADNQQIVQQMWEQLRPEVQTAMRHVHEEIAEQLRPEQIDRFHDWLNRHGTGPGPTH